MAEPRHAVAVHVVNRIIGRVPAHIVVTRVKAQRILGHELAGDRFVPACSSVIQLAVSIPQEPAEELLVLHRRTGLRTYGPETVEDSMIQHGSRRVDNVASCPCPIFQWPENAADRTLVRKDLVQ